MSVNVVQKITRSRLLAYAKHGLLNLYFSKMRSILALLGVLVGTASVVAMVLGGEIATNEALQQFKSLGTDLLAVATHEASSLNLQQTQNIETLDPDILKVAPYTQVFQPIQYNGEVVNGMILGVTDSFAEALNIKLKYGRFVSLLDNYESYCVIGQAIYKQIKAFSLQEPLGQQLQLGKHIFTIVGVAETWTENSFVNANLNDSIMIPLMASTMLSEYATINNIIFKLSDTANIPKVQTTIANYLKPILSETTFSFRNAKELISKMEKQSSILTIFLGLIGSISLIVGGIGVMNIMLVSVMERRHEIGIRLALGATQADIVCLFLMESVMLSLVGGFAGVIIGVLIAYIIALLSHWQFTLYLWPLLAGFSVSSLVGVFFGFYPAYQAAKLDPVTSLRV